MVKKEAVNLIRQDIVEENEDAVSPDELFDDLESTSN